MKVFINKITGYSEAWTSLLMSKRSWTREKELSLQTLERDNTLFNGKVIPSPSVQFEEWMDKIIKWGVDGFQDLESDICIQGHTTLLRFIDISITVEGLHRAGQDDLDSHAARMDNRIVRSSTRLATFSDGEKSEWYQNKILYPFEVIRDLGIKLPNVFIDEDGDRYVKTDFGYIREDLENDKDVKRGLYPEAIPSNFTFKIQYPELCHIYQHRDELSGANPEVKKCVEQIAAELKMWNEWLYDNLRRVKMQPVVVKGGKLI